MANQEREKHNPLVQQLEDYRAGKLNPSYYRSMIMDWGKTGMLEARPDIEPFLHHPDPFIRSNALHALAIYFRLQDYWPTAVHFMLYDPHFIARREGALALGWLKNNTQDRRTLSILASVVSDPYDNEDTRDYAYDAMQRVAYGDFELTGSDFYLDQDADWEFIKAALDPGLQEERRAEALELLGQFQAGQVAEQDYYAMLLKFGRARLQEARMVVESFLTSETLLLQIAALHVLVLYLQVPGNWQLAVDALQQGAWSGDRDQAQHDPISEYKKEAAFALGRLMLGTRDKKTLRILDACFNVGEEVMLAISDVYFGDHQLKHNEHEASDEIRAYLASPDDENK